MDFCIPDDLLELKQRARAFAERELAPYEDEMEENNGLPEAVEVELCRKAVAAGMNALGMPKEVGGQGLGTLGEVVVTEELVKYGTGLAAIPPSPSNILLACNEEQRERFLYPAVRGEKQDCFAITEPGAGSDTSGLQTTAKKQGSDWVLNGQKRYISHADTSDFAIVFAVTAPESERDRVTAFLVETGTPGYTIGPVHRTMGVRGYRQAPLFFENCHVPEENVLGEVGHGFDLAREWLTNGRILVGARCTGPAERLIEAARNYALERVQFGRPIADNQAVQFMLADSATELYAARMMTYNAAWAADNGASAREIHSKSAMVKVFASEMLNRVADRALQIFGGAGYMKGNIAERWYRDSRIERIWEGTSEIQRGIIARGILKHNLYF